MQKRLFEKALKDLPLSDFDYFQSTGSTNDQAAQWVASGGQGIYLAIADEQISGRGRSGRKWFTPPNSALAFSLAFVGGQNDLNFAQLAAGFVGVAICNTVDSQFGTQTKIKWPNDLLLANKKFGGILIEGQWQGQQLESLLIGVGINIAPKSIPPKSLLSFPATCLEDFSQKPIDRIALLVSIVKEIINQYQDASGEEMIKSWEKRLAYMNEKVQLSMPSQQVKIGRIVGLNGQGHLLIESQSGITESVAAGEIHLRPFVDSGDK